jgi:hypothetical protein
MLGCPTGVIPCASPGSKPMLLKTPQCRAGGGENTGPNLLLLLYSHPLPALMSDYNCCRSFTKIGVISD